MSTKESYIKTDAEYGIPEFWRTFEFRGKAIKISNYLNIKMLDKHHYWLIYSNEALCARRKDSKGDFLDSLTLTYSAIALAVRYNDVRLLASGIRPIRKNGVKNDYSLDNLEPKGEIKLYFESLPNEEWKRIPNAGIEVSNFFRVRKLNKDGIYVVRENYTQPEFKQYKSSMCLMTRSHLRIMNPDGSSKNYNIVKEALRLFRGLDYRVGQRYNFKTPSHANEGFYSVEDLYIVTKTQHTTRTNFIYDRSTKFVPIPDYPHYEINKRGEVRTHDSVARGRNNSDRPIAGRVMKPNNGGYIIRNEKGVVNKRIVDLLYTTFVGPIPENHYIDYYDGNPCNRRIDNLYPSNHQPRKRYKVK